MYIKDFHSWFHFTLFPQLAGLLTSLFIKNSFVFTEYSQPVSHVITSDLP